MSVEYTINLSAALSGLTITLGLLIAAAVGTDFKIRLHRYFYALLLQNLVVILAEFAIGLLEGHTGVIPSIVVRFFDYVSYIIPGLSMYTFALYISEYMSAKIEIPKGFLRLMAFFCIGIIFLATVAQFNHMYAFFDANNYYHEQRTYWISQIFPAAAVAAYLAVILKRIRAFKPVEWISIALYAIVPLICYIIEIAAPGIWIAHFGSSVMLFMIFINIQSELKHQARLQEAELTKTRIAVMLSQIQPHFLYNSLSAISGLCVGNPDANKALITFSEYLRGNMDALSQKEPIPFEKELEHTKQYLWLEQLRFEERLQVVYRIQTQDFLLPVLTLQPIVENAVRYGVTKKRSGGMITIQTEELEECFRITVLDDGMGFDISAPLPDIRSHTGISNVRDRLEAMCGGKLEINSSIGNGTTVTIDIPKGGAT